MRAKELKRILSKVDKINGPNPEVLNMNANIERLCNKILSVQAKRQGKTNKNTKARKKLNKKLVGTIATVAAAIVFIFTGGIICNNMPNNFNNNNDDNIIINPGIQSIGQAGVMYAVGYNNIELGEDEPEFIILKDGQLGKKLYVWLPEGMEPKDWDYYKNLVIDGGDAPGWLKNNNYEGVLFFYGEELLISINGKITYYVEQGTDGWHAVKSEGTINEVIWKPGKEEKEKGKDGEKSAGDKGVTPIGPNEPEFIVLKDGQLGKTLYIWLPEGAEAEDWEYYKGVMLASGDVPGWLKNDNYDEVAFFYGEECVKSDNGKIEYRIEQRADGWYAVKSDGSLGVVWVPSL